ncbi:MAG: rhamnosyltransferase [Arenicella sp.]|jgi:rhamnosyltransferase
MSDRVLAIIVCHNPQIDSLAVALRTVVKQVAATLVVDNASANVAEIEQLLGVLNAEQPSFSASLLKQTNNLGLGAAHNLGFQFARTHGLNHCLILDQDSVPMDGMVANLLLAAKSKLAGKAVKLSAVGATYLNADNGTESFFIRFGALKFRRQYCAERDSDSCIEADFLISSGCLIALSAIDDIGLMDEGLFIDHVDTEWFLRAKSKGYQAFGVCNAVMQHGLGEQTHQISLPTARGRGRLRNVPQHKPFRYYYIFRNSIVLYKRSYASSLWKWNDSQRLLMIAVMFGAFKTPRWKNLKMMYKGVVDGIKGVSGPAELN